MTKRIVGHPILLIVFLTLLAPQGSLLKAQIRRSTNSSPAGSFVFQGKEEQKLFRILQNRKWGYINSAGAIVIKPQFVDASDFSEGLAFVRYREKEKPLKPGEKTAELVIGAGYIDETGKVVLEIESPSYFEGDGFQEGLIRFWTGVSGSSLYGYLDKAGRIIIKPKFSLAYPFVEGLAGACIDRKCGYIDKTGEFVIEPKFTSVQTFSEGFAVVGVDIESVGFVNKSGELAIAPQFGNQGAIGFREGMSVVVYSGGPYGFINTEGVLVIPMQFEEAFAFSEGLAAVQVKGKWGYVDKAGKYVIEPRFVAAGSFTDGLAPFGNTPISLTGRAEPSTEDNGFGYIDKTGKVVIEPRFDRAYNFINGLARVDADGGWGYIDKAGKYVWKPTK